MNPSSIRRSAIAALAILLAANAAARAGSYDGLSVLDRYVLPYSTGLNGTTYSGTLFGGISGLDYDSATGRYVALSDDRSQNAPAGGNPAARFYDISIAVGPTGFVGPNPVTINSVTTLQRPDGSSFPALGVDPESIRVRRTGSGATLYWTSEGAVSASSNPPLQNTFVREMNLDGSYVRELAAPAKMTPDAVGAAQTTGIRNNLAYESLAITPSGAKAFAGVESALFQDGPRADFSNGSTNRIVKYDIATGAAEAEFVYATDPIPGAFNAVADNGLAELLAISETQFLAVERSFNLAEGNNIRIYRIDTAGATDVSGLNSLVGQSFTPVTKQLLITLPPTIYGGAFPADNIEAITFGPTLPNGEQTLILASDNNFSGTQVTQFVLLVTPEPATLALLALGALATLRRRKA